MPLWGLGERRELPSGVWGSAPAANVLAYFANAFGKKEKVIFFHATTPHFPILDSALFRLDSTYWLYSR